MEIETEIYHLQPLPKYDTEKPYTMRYVPDASIPATNVAREKKLVRVKDIRGTEDQYDLERNGFMVAKLASNMSYDDFDHQEKITEVYLQELRVLLSTVFPGCEIDFVSYLIRKRERNFPYSTGESYNFGQPNIVAHIDTTPADLKRQIRQRYPLDSDQYLTTQNRWISIWKPLRGPLYDWPLALCDSTTVNIDKDLEPQDIVDRDEVLENVHVYHKSRHQWYYLSGQETSEVLIFRQADTQPERFGTVITRFNFLWLT